MGDGEENWRNIDYMYYMYYVNLGCAFSLFRYGIVLVSFLSQVSCFIFPGPNSPAVRLRTRLPPANPTGCYLNAGSCNRYGDTRD